MVLSRAVRDLDSIQQCLFCTEHTPFSQHITLKCRVLAKTREASCSFFFVSEGGFRLFREGHDKDDVERCEDVVERDADGHATQKL